MGGTRATRPVEKRCEGTAATRSGTRRVSWTEREQRFAPRRTACSLGCPCGAYSRYARRDEPPCRSFMGIPDRLVAALTAHGIHALRMGEETMETGLCRRWGSRALKENPRSGGPQTGRNPSPPTFNVQHSTAERKLGWAQRAGPTSGRPVSGAAGWRNPPDPSRH